MIDEMKNWTATEMASNPKLQTLMEKAAWLEHELVDFIKTADCRKSRDNLEVG